MGSDRRRTGAGLRALIGFGAILGGFGFLLVIAVLSAGLAGQDGACGAELAPVARSSGAPVQRSGGPSAGASSAGASSPAAPGLPAAFMPYFTGAAQQFGLGPDGWAYLAAINDVESGFDDTNLPGVGSGANLFGAAGPMQIGIGGAAGNTWATYAVAGVPGGVSPPSVYDEADAVYAAANLLHSAGAPADWPGAIFDYNHASWYVDRVSALAAQYASMPLVASATCAAAAGPPIAGSTASVVHGGEAAIPDAAPVAVQEMLVAGNRIIDQPYSYGGAHAPASMGVPPDAAADPGRQENGGPGFDCSSAVDYVLWGAGLGQSLLGGQVPASQTLASIGDPGPGKWVTIYAGESGGQAHTFIEVDGVVLDTVHLFTTTPAGTGPRWQPDSEVAMEQATGSFVARHPPGL